MRPRTRLFLALALLLSPVTARADKAANKPAPHVPTKAEVEALDSRQAQDYYRSNTEWSTWASSVAQACEPYKAFFGAGFPCTIDEPAAEAFYWNEVKTKSPDKWNTNNPGWACDSSSMVNVTTPFEVCKDSKKCTEEFKSRIKAVECSSSVTSARA